MHAVSHSLAHRGPGATRARARWQPYASPSPSVSSRSSVSSNYPNTPASSVTTSPASTYAPSICDFERQQNPLPNPPSTSQAPKEAHYRDTQRGRYLTSLIDQAVKSLCEIWHPADIPVVFQTSARVPFCAPSQTTTAPTTNQYSHSHHHTRNIQLLSPVSPSSPCSPSSQSSTSSPSDSCMGGPAAAAQCSKSNLLPLRNFVHEVLRRSKTSGCVLQTALCYLEAIRCKVPELMRKERDGEGAKGESESASRIIFPEEEDAEALGVSLESISSKCYVSPATTSSGDEQDTDVMDTVRIQDGCAAAPQSQSTAGPSTSLAESSTRFAGCHPCMEGIQKKPKGPSAPLPPLPRLPSPLLCPRRAFLASLILASKFMQDKCYSNRAWAKLSGLHPREIGRCERALGDALEWRLWVGKAPTKSESAGARGVARCKSEADLGPPSRSSDLPCFNAYPSSAPSQFNASSVEWTAWPTVSNSAPRPNMLRRSSTVPALPTGTVSEEYSMLTSMGYNPRSGASRQPAHDAIATFNGASDMSSLAAIFYESAFSNGEGCSSWPGAAANVDGYQRRPWAAPVEDNSPPTPTLSYSPSSTTSSESSSDGDRTIQMTALSDADVPTHLLQFPPLLGGGFPGAADFMKATSFPLSVPVVVGGNGAQSTVDISWFHQASMVSSSGALGVHMLGGSVYQQ
ncbi:hypothetical protein GLOTRDRAFT_137720 [Gloeophyllum trabeum ATCC 11539]|uniref:Cyclin N-terminal domain-containing protein n=1 Tax=Gloeophyllum trabeum (strain ATCC 11539 / FP-39264 / Madison 617) TaxID=670483 RepID=S7RRW7_GLOTA|nr:uncharacterized protein GLOTRDRAFT_137720 [Gloeophyllum trabeum ATCC 11539]EPQ57385.1 hypothetical protein GLOTRDRAFT_137720 [Gloeophyllum trabeum ATCC 11539]